MANAHPYLNNLTPLRGIAALWVAVFHFELTYIGFYYPPHTQLVAEGYLMVDLFFIMSGLIIRHVYGDRFAHQITGSNLKRFMVARFARIYPLHFFTLTFLIVEVCFSGEWDLVSDPAAIPTNILLLQSFPFHKIATWNRLSWSLSAEWVAYMVFPLLAIWFGRKGKWTHIILPPLILIAYLSILYWLPQIGYGNVQRLVNHRMVVSYDYGFLRGIAGFALGMLSYGLYKNIRTRKFFGKDEIAVVFTLGTLLCIHKGVNDLLLILIFVGLVLSFASNEGLLHKLCSVKPAQFIGKISYSVYLIQPIANSFFNIGLELSGLKKLFPPFVPVSFSVVLVYMVFYLSLLVGLSSLTYYGIENPCRNFINRNHIQMTLPIT